MSSGGMFLLFGNDFVAPPLDGLTHFGCTSYELNDKSVRSTAWAEYDDAHLEAVRQNHIPLATQKEFPHRGWAHLISQRYGKRALKKAALDCVDWNNKMQQMVNANQKEPKK
jgi:hypothetical protein